MTYPPLYWIADPALYEAGDDISDQGGTRFLQAVETAVEAGICFIQYRDKSSQRGLIYKRALRLREICTRGKVTFIVNDEIDIALAVEADGVHLGQDDFPIEMARSVLKSGIMVGISTHNLAQALEAQSSGADYIGYGPIFKTQTKISETAPLGMAAIAEIREKVSIPIYAIGGIQWPQAQDVLAAGATGVALASALAGASKETLQEWIKTLHPPS